MFNNQNTKEIIETATSQLESLFHFVKWNSKTFKEIVNKQIEKQANKDIEIEDFIKVCEFEVIKKIPSKIKKLEDVGLITSFIEFISTYTRYNKYTKLQAIAEFFNSIKGFKESITYSTILEDNKVLYQIIDDNININQIDRKKLQIIMNDTSVNWLITDYCSINEIDILDMLEVEVTNSDITVVEHDSITTILRSATILSKEEKAKLIREYKEGSKRAQELLIKSHLRFIAQIARRYIGRGVPLLDLFQEGILGFMKAMDKYDIESHSNVQLTTYAYSWIRQAIGHLIHDQGKTIRLPVYIIERRNKVLNTARILEYKLNRDPTYQEIADELGLTKKQVEDIYKLPDTVKSLNDVVGEDNDTYLEELIKDETAIDPEESSEKSDTRERIQYYLSLLKSRRTEQILRMRFGLYNGEEMTLEQVGKEFNLTRERIRQLEAKGLKELKRIIERESRPALYRQLPPTPPKTTHTSKTNQPSKNTEIKPKEKNNMEEEKKTNSDATAAPTEEVVVATTQEQTQKKKRGKKTRTIYELFDQHSKEEVDYVISELSGQDKELFDARNGADLENPPLHPNWTKEQRQAYYSSVLPKIKRRLEGAKKTPTKSKKTKSTTPPTQTVSTKKQSTSQTTSAKKTQTVAIEEVPQSSFEEIFRHPIFQEKARQLSLEETVVISLKLGYINQKVIETSTIAELLGMSEESVNEITKNVLSSFKNDLLTILNDQPLSNGREGKGAYTKSPNPKN